MRRIGTIAPLLFSVFMTLMVLTGCSSMEPKDGGTISAMEEALDPEPRASAPAAPTLPPPAVSSALLPPMELGAAGAAGRRETRFDINVTETPAREFFMGLVDGTPYNMVVHPTVTGNISLSLKNITIPEVMEVLQQVYGYEFRSSRSGYQVMPARLQSRIFQVNYLNLQRVGRSHTRVSSGQISDVNSGSGGSSSNDQSGTSGGLISGSQINTESTSDFWGELTVALNALVGQGEGRAVVVMPQSGVVVIRAMPAEIREVEDYLRATDNIMHRQVILEAKILEVELNDGYEAGINWAKMISVNGNKLGLGQSNGGNIFGDTRARKDIPTGGISDPKQPPPLDFVDFKAFGGFFGAVMNTGNFMAFIELLGLQGNVQVLSSPRISTVNNQKAVIKVGTDEFFVTDVSSDNYDSVAGASNRVSNDIELTPFFSGIALDVTPQVDAKGRVTLHIHPTVSDVQDQQKEIDLGDSRVVLPLAKSTVRESDSIVYANSGQLVVIGGLMQDARSEKIASTPWLGDLPGIGALFRHTQQGAIKSELVILLRPTVVDNSDTWKSNLTESNDRIRNLDRGFHFGGRPDVFGNLGEKRL